MECKNCKRKLAQSWPAFTHSHINTITHAILALLETFSNVHLLSAPEIRGSAVTLCGFQENKSNMIFTLHVWDKAAFGGRTEQAFVTNYRVGCPCSQFLGNGGLSYEDDQYSRCTCCCLLGYVLFSSRHSPQHYQANRRLSLSQSIPCLSLEWLRLSNAFPVSAEIF